MILLLLDVFYVIIFKSATYLTLQEQAVARSAHGYVRSGMWRGFTPHTTTHHDGHRSIVGNSEGQVDWVWAGGAPRCLKEARTMSGK